MTTSTKFLLAALLCCIAASLGAQTPSLLKDIHTGIGSSTPQSMTLSGNTIFFNADDEVHERELWKTDGTEDNTVMINDIRDFGASEPTGFCDLNGIVYFTASTFAEGRELWKSDGTLEGTVLVADILPGPLDSKIYDITACNGKVYFGAIQVIFGNEFFKLYVSDGTAVGTKVLDYENNLEKPDNLTALGNTLYFSGATTAQGNEIWKTDGTTVELVMDIEPGSVGSYPRTFIKVGNKLFFSARDSLYNCQLWKTSGTAATTLRVSIVQLFAVMGPEIKEIANVSGTVFYSAESGIPGVGTQIYKVNSAATTSTLITVIVAESLTAHEGKLFFTQRPSAANPILSYINSNGAVVTNLREFSETIDGSGIPQRLVSAIGNLFFTAGRPQHGIELWKSNGTVEGTLMVQDLAGGAKSSNIKELCVREKEVFFSCYGPFGNELRRSDGTLNGFILVRDITQASSAPSGFIKFGNYTYFAANNNANGRELWRSDGTEAGTSLFKDIPSGFNGSEPDNFIVVNNTLFFVAGDNTHGRELWKSNGTAAGTVRISDIVAGSGDAGITNMTNVNGVLHFTASSGAATGDRIYKTNAALTGVAPTGGDMWHANSLVVMGGVLYFTQSPTFAAQKLCKLVAGQTLIVRTFDLIPGWPSSVPQKLKVIGSRLFFTAADATYGRELWKSNGTSAGTVRISDIITGIGSSVINNLTNFNGTLHFTSKGVNDTGFRIFKTNAAVTNVETTGGVHQNPYSLTPVGTKLYFGQYPFNSPEPQRLCKLENGITTVLKTFDILPNGQYSAATHLTVAGNTLYFTAGDAVNGREFWKSDGTIAGTTIISDLRPGIGNSNINAMYMSGNDLYLSLNTLEYGQEPYILVNAAALMGDKAEDRDASFDVIPDTDLEISVSPNPASSFVNVDLPGNEMDGVLSLLSTSGQLLRSVPTTSDALQVKLDLQDLPRGLYFIRWVRSDDKVVLKKLIVQ